MGEFLRWQSDDGPIVVEVDARAPGYQSVTRKSDGKIAEVEGRFEDALEQVRSAAVSALRTFRDKAVNADEISLEFGIKITAEAGAVIAKTSAEGHMAVKMTWSAAESAD